MLKKVKFAYAALMKCYPFQLDDLPEEEWLPVPDYELYQESNYGRTKSFRKGKPRIMRPAVSTAGYLQVNLNKNGVSKTVSVHRLVARLFIANPDRLPEVNHLDGCKLNNHISNLEWCTPSENIRHAVAVGLHASGVEDSQAILSREQVLFIRENPDDLNLAQLAEMFRTSKQTISRVQRGKTYKNIGGTFRAVKQGGSSPVPDDLRNQIRAEYKAGVRGCGSHALAEKYGYSQTTILKIVNFQ